MNYRTHRPQQRTKPREPVLSDTHYTFTQRAAAQGRLFLMIFSKQPPAQTEKTQQGRLFSQEFHTADITNKKSILIEQLTYMYAQLPRTRDIRTACIHIHSGTESHTPGCIGYRGSLANPRLPAKPPFSDYLPNSHTTSASRTQQHRLAVYLLPKFYGAYGAVVWPSCKVKGL